jgi:hypothetical protein
MSTLKALSTEKRTAAPGVLVPPYLLKAGVIGPPRAVLHAGLLIVADVYRSWGKTLVVTSLRDGKHKVGSLHPRGYAADLRSSTLGGANIECVVRQIQVRLGTDFQVIFEVDHIHLEYDPKRDGGRSLP